MKLCCACYAQALVAVPDNMDDVLAAQAFVNPLTAIGIVEVLPGLGWDKPTSEP